jgi:Short C-terminal domain
MKPIILFVFMTISSGFIFNCSSVNTQVNIEKSDIQFSKPQASTELLKGENVGFELWVDNGKWEIYGSKDTVFKDFRNMLGSQGIGLSHVLRHHSGESMAIIQEIHTQADFEILHKTLIESLSMGKGSIVGEDIRRVNGSDVLYIKWIEDLGTSKIVWLSYYLTNNTGHMRLAGGTTEDLLAEYESDIIDLLNGLVDSNLKIQPKTSVAVDVEKKLSKLKNLLDKGLITQEDYDKKKTELLATF